MARIPKLQCSDRPILLLPLVVLIASTAVASVMVAPVSGLGNVTLTAVYSTRDGGLLGADLRGSSLVAVTGASFSGNVVLTDGGAAPTFGNAVLLATNLPSFSELIAVGFDTTKSTLTGSLMEIPGTGIPLGTVSDPALTAMLGSLDYGFVLTTFTPLADNTGVATFDFTGTVPEPGVGVLSGAGLVIVLLLRKSPLARRSKTAVARRS